MPPCRAHPFRVASHTPASPNFTGTWTVDVSFAGDSKRLPSKAASCLVAYQ